MYAIRSYYEDGNGAEGTAILDVNVTDDNSVASVVLEFDGEDKTMSEVDDSLYRIEFV